jgi:putative ABC transport system permease protein
MAPYAVRRIAVLGRLLPLTGRHAFRDAARHRFRTAAAAVALTITTGALALGTFALGSAAAVQRGNDPGGHPTPRRPRGVAAARSTGDGTPGGSTDAWISPGTGAAHDLGTRPMAVIAVADREITSDDLTALAVRGIVAYSGDPLTYQTRWQTLAALGLGGLLTALVAGIAVALAAAEGRNDMATLAAIGASPTRRRMLGAGHGLFLGLTGTALGPLIGLPAGLSLTQLDGLDGVQLPWRAAGATVLLVPLVAALTGWVVTPTRLTLVRRGG